MYEKIMLNALIKDFIMSQKNRLTFNDFIKYFYFFFDEKIKSEKNKSLKNKYIKMRQSILEYIVNNKRLIIHQINQKVNHK